MITSSSRQFDSSEEKNDEKHVTLPTFLTCDDGKTKVDKCPLCTSNIRFLNMASCTLQVCGSMTCAWKSFVTFESKHKHDTDAINAVSLPYFIKLYAPATTNKRPLSNEDNTLPPAKKSMSVRSDDASGDLFEDNMVPVSDAVEPATIPPSVPAPVLNSESNAEIDDLFDDFDDIQFEF